MRHFHLKQLCHPGDSGGMPRLTGKVVQLVRIGGKIEELRLVYQWIADEFPALVTDGALAFSLAPGNGWTGGGVRVEIGHLEPWGAKRM